MATAIYDDLNSLMPVVVHSWAATTIHPFKGALRLEKGGTQKSRKAKSRSKTWLS